MFLPFCRGVRRLMLVEGNRIESQYGMGCGRTSSRWIVTSSAKPYGGYFSHCDSSSLEYSPEAKSSNRKCSELICAWGSESI